MRRKQHLPQARIVVDNTTAVSQYADGGGWRAGIRNLMERVAVVSNGPTEHFYVGPNLVIPIACRTNRLFVN